MQRSLGYSASLTSATLSGLPCFLDQCNTLWVTLFLIRVNTLGYSASQTSATLSGLVCFSDQCNTLWVTLLLRPVQHSLGYSAFQTSATLSGLLCFSDQCNALWVTQLLIPVQHSLGYSASHTSATLSGLLCFSDQRNTLWATLLLSIILGVVTILLELFTHDPEYLEWLTFCNSPLGCLASVAPHSHILKRSTILIVLKDFIFFKLKPQWSQIIHKRHLVIGPPALI